MILEILGIAAIAVFISKLSNWPQLAMHYTKLKRLKPFDCTMCMSFWLGAYFYFVYPPITAVFCHALGVVLAVWADNKVFKLKDTITPITNNQSTKKDEIELTVKIDDQATPVLKKITKEVKKLNDKLNERKPVRKTKTVSRRSKNVRKG